MICKLNAVACLKLLFPKMLNQIDIQRYIENVNTNPRWGQDPSQIKFPVFQENHSGQESENFLITSKVERDDDPQSLYYRLTFRDVSLKEWRLQLTPVVSIKTGFLKVLPNGEMIILNNRFEDSSREILPVSKAQSSEWLAYFRIQYRMQKFTDAKFSFVAGKLTFRNGFEVSENHHEETEGLFNKINTYLASFDRYCVASSLAVAATVGGAIYLVSRRREPKL